MSSLANELWRMYLRIVIIMVSIDDIALSGANASLGSDDQNRVLFTSTEPSHERLNKRSYVAEVHEASTVVVHVPCELYLHCLTDSSQK